MLHVWLCLSTRCCCSLPPQSMRTGCHFKRHYFLWTCGSWSCFPSDFGHVLQQALRQQLDHITLRSECEVPHKDQQRASIPLVKKKSKHVWRTCQAGETRWLLATWQKRVWVQFCCANLRRLTALCTLHHPFRHMQHAATTHATLDVYICCVGVLRHVETMVDLVLLIVLCIRYQDTMAGRGKSESKLGLSSAWGISVASLWHVLGYERCTFTDGSRVSERSESEVLAQNKSGQCSRRAGRQQWKLRVCRAFSRRQHAWKALRNPPQAFWCHHNPWCTVTWHCI